MTKLKSSASSIVVSSIFVIDLVIDAQIFKRCFCCRNCSDSNIHLLLKCKHRCNHCKISALYVILFAAL